MIYFALRSPEYYLTKLAHVRSSQSEHHLVAVAGDLSFLHAIGASTLSVSVIDSDEEIVRYCGMVVRLIQAARSLDHFIEVMTRHRIERREGGFVLTEPVDMLPFVNEALVEHAHLSCYHRTIGAMRVQPSQSSAKLGKNTILFQGADLTPFRFSWRFGEGNFADETTFATLQSVLKSKRVSVEQERLEGFDFSTLSESTPVTFLAGSCDSPIFTRGDVVFRSVGAACTAPTRYISWHRDLVLFPHSARRSWDAAPPARELSVADLPMNGITLLAPRSGSELIELHSVSPGSVGPVRYLSRSRVGEFLSQYVWSDDSPQPGGERHPPELREQLVSGCDVAGVDSSDAVACYSTVRGLYDSSIYGGRLLVICLDGLESQTLNLEHSVVSDIYQAATPRFFKLLFLTSESLDVLQRVTAAARYSLSYELSAQGRCGNKNYLSMHLQTGPTVQNPHRL